MRSALGSLLLALTLAFAAVPPAEAGGGGVRPRVDQRYPPLHRANPGLGVPPRLSAPPPRSSHRGGYYAAPRRPVFNCDSYGRCWQQVPYGNGYGGRAGTRPPGWADSLPYRAQGSDRFLRPRSGVVCDRATSVCYKGNEVDKTETRDLFGDRAADRADDLRDQRGTARLFVPERGVTCDRSRQVCFDDDSADSSLTRRYFGRRAADAVN
jgi:hypothetical protein